MPDMSSVQPVSGLGNAVRPTPLVPEPPVMAPAKTSDTSTATDHQDARDPQSEAESTRSLGERRTFDENVLTGPPPTFEASLLEVEANLDAILRRIEARREISSAQEVVGLAAMSAQVPEAPSNLGQETSPLHQSINGDTSAIETQASTTPHMPVGDQTVAEH